ncbi:MAG: 4Fe-4S binding protein [Candidatus Omnitrophota bacterium]
MSRIKIDKNKCKSCEYCVIYCPHKLIFIDDTLNKMGYRVAVYKESGACKGCGMCVMVCPQAAIEVCK